MYTAQWMGEQIRRARLARGWTQAILGRELHRGQPHIAEVEAGSRPVSVHDLQLFGKVFNSHAFYNAVALYMTNGCYGEEMEIAGGYAGSYVVVRREAKEMVAAAKALEDVMHLPVASWAPEKRHIAVMSALDIRRAAGRFVIELEAASSNFRAHEDNDDHHEWMFGQGYVAAKRNGRPLARTA